jgi:4-amino-4-deoxy-L-arabinose transferase-like glycosyltransferase
VGEDGQLTADRPSTAPGDGTEARPARTWVLVIIGLAVTGNVIGIRCDHQSPAWDQANYLHIAFTVRHAFSTFGFRSGMTAYFHTESAYAPLYTLAIQPFEVVSNGVDAALVANTLILAGTIGATAVIAFRLFGRRAAIAAALFEATCPIIYGLSRTTLVDTLLVLLAALSVMAAVLSEGFTHRRWAVLCGVFVGLATLTKMTAPGILILPLALSIGLPPRVQLRRQLTNALVAAVVAVGVALTWYAINFSAALAYLHSATSGRLALGLTQDPFTARAFEAFLSNTINSAVGTLLVLVLLVAGAPALSALRRRRASRVELIGVAIPISWFGVAFLSLAVSHNQDVRYLAPGITGLVVLAAAAVTAIEPRRLQWWILAGATVALTWQYVSYVLPDATPSGTTVAVGPTSLRVILPFDGPDLSYTRPPGLPDYADPIVSELSAYQRHKHPNLPLTICLLESQQVINGNTLGYVAQSRGIRFTFVNLSYVPTMPDATLAAELATCPAALWIPGGDAGGTGRVAVLNSSSAAVRITPAELATFDRPRIPLPVGRGLMVEVLTRR